MTHQIADLDEDQFVSPPPGFYENKEGPHGPSLF